MTHDRSEMSTRIDNAVTLAHKDADAVSRLLSDYASHLYDVACASKSAVVKEHATCRADQARTIARQIIEALWTWK